MLEDEDDLLGELQKEMEQDEEDIFKESAPIIKPKKKQISEDEQLLEELNG